MLSVSHLIVIFVVALVIFGPEKLPELARNLGKVMAEFKRITGEMRYTFEDHMRELEREAEQRKAPPPAAAAALPPQTAENTISSKPPHGVIPAGASEEPSQPGLFDPQSPAPPESSSAPESAPPADSLESREAQPISNTETVNDGGVRPA